MQKIIQFGHPGLQLNLSTRSKNRRYQFYADKKSGVRLWNDDTTHHRKFIQTRAQYLDGSTLKTDEVQFWGEWEPQSEFFFLGNRGSYLPNAIHRPLLCTGQNPTLNYTYQNTDPYTWQSPAYYALCKQPSYSFLRKLEKNSLVIFGTEYAKGFAVDTVLVIGDSELQRPYVEGKSVEDEMYEKAAYCKIRDWLKNEIYSKTNASTKLIADEMRMYRSLTYREDKTLFTFSPCKLAVNNPLGFERLYLNPKKYQFQPPGAGTVCYRVRSEDGSAERSLDDVKSTWSMIVQDCRDQGFDLMLKAEPKIEMVPELPTQKIYK